MNNNKTKYTVALPKEISTMLDNISNQLIMSKPEVLRRCIGIYDYLLSEKMKGSKVFILDKSDNQKEVIIL